MELKAHIHSRHDPHCPHCDFSDLENMEKHLKTVHLNTKVYTCQDCQRNFPGPKSYWDHRKESHVVEEKAQNEENLCVFCHRKFRHLMDLFQHVYERHDPCCPQCNHVARQNNMSAHFDQFHHLWDDIASVKCSVWGCVKRFKSLQEYWTHRLEKHPEVLHNLKPAAKRAKLEK